LGFAQIEMSDRTKVSLEELAARWQIKALERVCQQLEIGSSMGKRRGEGRRGWA